MESSRILKFQSESSYKGPPAINAGISNNSYHAPRQKYKVNFRLIQKLILIGNALAWLQSLKFSANLISSFAITSHFRHGKKMNTLQITEIDITTSMLNIMMQAVFQRKKNGLP